MHVSALALGAIFVRVVERGLPTLHDYEAKLPHKCMNSQ